MSHLPTYLSKHLDHFLSFSLSIMYTDTHTNHLVTCFFKEDDNKYNCLHLLEKLRTQSTE